MSPRERSKIAGDRFKDRLKAARREAGLTQEQLVTLAECAPITLSKLETGANKPTFEILVALADALNVSPNYLAGWEETGNRDLRNNPVLVDRLSLAAAPLSDEWLEILIALAHKARSAPV